MLNLFKLQQSTEVSQLNDVYFIIISCSPFFILFSSIFPSTLRHFCNSSRWNIATEAYESDNSLDCYLNEQKYDWMLCFNRDKSTIYYSLYFVWCVKKFTRTANTSRRIHAIIFRIILLPLTRSSVRWAAFRPFTELGTLSNLFASLYTCIKTIIHRWRWKMIQLWNSRVMRVRSTKKWMSKRWANHENYG